MINSTVNLKLKKPDDLESFDVEHMNFNSDTIDKAVGNLSTLKTAKKDSLVNAVNEVKEGLSTLKLESTAIDVVDTANNFNGDSSGKKLLEDVLVQIDKKAKEAFQGADSGKKIIATAVGSPLNESDTFTAMGTKIDALTNILKTNLISKRVNVDSQDKMKKLIDKVNDIKVTQYAINEKILPKVFETKTSVTLPTPVTQANYYEKNNQITYFNGRPAYGASGWYLKRTTINKDTFEVISNVDSTHFNEFFYNVYVKLKSDDTKAIYEGSGYLKFLDIITHTKETTKIPYDSDYDTGASVCKTDDNTAIYVFGGVYYNTSSSTSKRSGTRKYDPITKTWTTEPNLCKPVAECMSIKVDNFIYIFHNGFVDDKDKRVVRYDTLTKTSIELMDTLSVLMSGRSLYVPNIGKNERRCEEDYFIKDNKVYISTREAIFIFDIDKNIIDMLPLNTFGTSFKMRNYFVFNHKGNFYKCGGDEPHYNSSSYDPVVVKDVQMVCNLIY